MKKILLIGKKDDARCMQAISFLKRDIFELDVILGKRGELFPKEFISWQGDYIISYLSPWILPKTLLQQARKAAINFHPGPPEYPGIGCTNFAIYEGVKSYGVTCHHMASRVDTGEIIAVRRFPVLPNDSVYALTQRCYKHLLVCFFETISLIISGQSFPKVSEQWGRLPYTRKELNELCRLSCDMDEDEIKRRIKAVTYPGMPGAYIEIAGQKFVLETPEYKKEPL